MNKIVLVIAVLGSAILYSACSNDIDLAADWKDVPIVYGLLSASDTANYIRVQKAFLDNNKNAFDVAQISDSLYYDNITVRLKNLADPSESYVLNRVDGNLEGFPRESGVFANAPNYLYKLKLPGGESLSAGEEYQLELNRGDDLPLVTATAALVDDIEFRSPSSNPTNADAVKWHNLLRVEWRSKPTAYIFDVILYLHIEEKDVTNPANDRVTTLEWKVVENEIAQASGIGSTAQIRGEVRITGNQLYQYLGSKLEVNPNIARKFLSFDVLAVGGGEAFSEYLEAGNANTGITSTQVIPTFTNLSEGFGIFSSKNSEFHEGYVVNPETIDSIRNNQFSKDLNFQF